MRILSAQDHEKLEHVCNIKMDFSDIDSDEEVLYCLSAAAEALLPLAEGVDAAREAEQPLPSPWWDTHITTVTYEQFHVKFRMWPATLIELVCSATGVQVIAHGTDDWQRCLQTPEAKYIAHAAFVLVHGKSSCMHAYFMRIYTQCFADMSIRVTAVSLCLPRSTMFYYYTKGIDVLNAVFHAYIRWPTFEEIVVGAERFASWAGLRGVVGALDCSHVAILITDDDRGDYTNRKCFYSIHLQAVVDARERFIFIDVGCSGSMADVTAFKTCALARKQVEDMRSGRRPPVPLGYYLIADAGFFKVPWVVCNYSTAEAELFADCARFNGILSRTRMVVERVFGQLKARYSALGGRSSHVRRDSTVKRVKAAAVLHNANIDVESRVIGMERGPPRTVGVGKIREVADLQLRYTVPDTETYIGSNPDVLAAGKAVQNLAAADSLKSRGRKSALPHVKWKTGSNNY